MSNRETYEIPLHGCTPEPLMNYLKALGVLRLVSEQADPEARGAWRDGVFVLHSTLDENALVDFFVNQYCPTPIVAPWAGGSGFFGKDNRDAVNALAESENERCDDYRRLIISVRKLLDDRGQTEKPDKDKKPDLLQRYRRELPDKFVDWLDAAIVIRNEGLAFPPALGTGGNDGRFDFSNNFMQHIVEMKLHTEKSLPIAETWLKGSLFATSVANLQSKAVGQFAPGAAGGPNMTQGMEGSTRLNPWDFILTLEGSMMLAGAVVRRMGSTPSTKAAMSFVVNTSSIGFSSESDNEAADSRGEMWLPLWQGFSGFKELRLLFAEGRVNVGGRSASDGLDFARAVAELGVDRGIGEFSRIGFLRRNGKNYFATPLGRFKVQAQEDVGLLQSIDPWLDRFRRSCGDKTPPRFNAALRKIDAAIFDYCRYGGKERFAMMLRALGRAERELAGAERFRADKFIKPLVPLPSEWIEACDDKSVEFQLALSLAGIYAPKQDGKATKRLGGIRSNLEPVDEGRYPKWSDGTRAVVWNSADLSTNMLNVLARRMMDGSRAGLKSLPLASSRSAPKVAISAFIAGDVDDVKISELLWGLMLVKIERREESEEVYVPSLETPFTPLPRSFALLKLLFLSRKLKIGEEEIEIRSEPRIVPLLRTGRLGEACRIAMRRLRSSGVVPMPHRTGAQANRDDAWDCMMDDKQVRRLAAALLFPISTNCAANLAGMVFRRNTNPNDIENETSTSNTES